MKILDVKKALEQYSLHSGYFRWGPTKESHIKELEIFYIEINGKEGEVVKDRELTDEEYLKLTKIILDKKTWDHRAASISLGTLANKLGGRKALSHLKEKEKLSPANLKRIEQYTLTEERIETLDTSLPLGKDEEHGLMLSQLLEVLDPVIPFLSSHALAEICERANKEALANKLTFIQQLVDAKVTEKAAFLLILNRKNPKLLSDILVLLNKNGLCDESNIQKLDGLDIQDVTVSSAAKIALFNDILSLFAAADPLLMTQSYLSALFNFHELWWGIKAIAEGLSLCGQLNSTNITTLFHHVDAIEKGETIKALLGHFKHAGWPVEEYWELILKTVDRSGDILSAVSQLAQLDLISSQVQLTLSQLFTTPSQGQKIAKAVALLAQEAAPIDDEELKTVLSGQEHMLSLARGIAIAKKSPDYHADAKTFLSQHPEHAEGLALAYNQLAAAGQNTIKNRKLLCSIPEKAIYLGFILQYISQAGLLQKESSNCQENIEIIMECASHWQGLHKACVRLSKKEKLNQPNLTLLLETPDDAEAIAEILCEGALEESQGKPKPMPHDEKKAQKSGWGLFRFLGVYNSEESPKPSYRNGSEKSEENDASDESYESYNSTEELSTEMVSTQPH